MAGRSYTASEWTRRAGWLVSGSRNAYAEGGTDKAERQIDAIDRRAADRWDREAGAAGRLLEQARNDHAMARARQRATKGEDRRAAREATRKAKQALDRAERAGRRYGL